MLETLESVFKLFMKKSLLYICLLITLNGCLQSTASLLGPAYTVANTGNIYQASLSFTANQTLIHLTGKSSLEHAGNAFKNTNRYKDRLNFKKYRTAIP